MAEERDEELMLHLNTEHQREAFTVKVSYKLYSLLNV